jgi:AcrR family transcriptional regulator
METPPPNLRDRRAELTRQSILDAARRLFAERGYSRTSVRDIAEAAGVSAQTVYDSIGSKQVIVGRLNDLLDREAGVSEIARAAAASDDAGFVVATNARITAAILRSCGDIVHALVTGAAAEPALAAALDEGQRRHRGGVVQIVGMLEGLHALAPGIDHDHAVDTLAAISDVRFAMMLRDSYGWSLERVEDWIGATSRALLLRHPD